MNDSEKFLVDQVLTHIRFFAPENENYDSKKYAAEFELGYKNEKLESLFQTQTDAIESRATEKLILPSDIRFIANSNKEDSITTRIKLTRFKNLLDNVLVNNPEHSKQPFNKSLKWYQRSDHKDQYTTEVISTLEENTDYDPEKPRQKSEASDFEKLFISTLVARHLSGTLDPHFRFPGVRKPYKSQEPTEAVSNINAYIIKKELDIIAELKNQKLSLNIAIKENIKDFDPEDLDNEDIPSEQNRSRYDFN